MATEIAYAGENTLDALARVIKKTIAETAFPDNPGDIVFGTDKHDELKNRDLPDQHPIGAIAGLSDALEGIQTNAHNINTLRESNTIDHNAIRQSITTLTEDVGALSGIPADVEKFKMEVGGEIDKANEAIQKNADDIKALQDAGSDNVALGTIYVSEWLENGDPPTVGTPVNVGLGDFIGAKPEHNTIYYAVIRRGSDVYFCSVRYNLTGETSSVTPTSVVKIGGSDSPVVTDANPTFVGWATTYVNGTSESFHVPYSRVSNKPDTGDAGLIIAVDVNGNGTWIVYGLCAGDVDGSTFAMQMTTEVRVDKPEVTLPTFGNLILNTSFTTPPITGEVYPIPVADFNREPMEATTVSGIVRFEDDTYYVEGGADPLPEEPDRGPVATFNKVVKMTANMLFFIETFSSVPTVGRAYNIPEDRFTRRPQRRELCSGIAIVDDVMYLCYGEVVYNPNMLPQYNPAPTITVNTVKRLSAPDTISWDKITGKPDLSIVYRYKGSVATDADLPETAEVGDVYNVIATDMNWAWTGTEWDPLGGTVDLTDVNQAISNLETKVNQNGSAIGALEDRPVTKGILTEAEFNALPESERNSGLYFLEKEMAEGGGSSGGGYEEVYSTKEQRIGTWIDGRPLYRKTYVIENVRTKFETGGINYGILQVGDSTFLMHKAFGEIRSQSGSLMGAFPWVALQYSSSGSSGTWGIGVLDRGGSTFIGVITGVDAAVSPVTVSIVATFEYTRSTDQPEVTA